MVSNDIIGACCNWIFRSRLRANHNDFFTIFLAPYLGKIRVERNYSNCSTWRDVDSCGQSVFHIALNENRSLIRGECSNLLKTRFTCFILEPLCQPNVPPGANFFVDFWRVIYRGGGVGWNLFGTMIFNKKVLAVFALHQLYRFRPCHKSKFSRKNLHKSI